MFALMVYIHNRVCQKCMLYLHAYSTSSTYLHSVAFIKAIGNPFWSHSKHSFLHLWPKAPLARNLSYDVSQYRYMHIHVCLGTPLHAYWKHYYKNIPKNYAIWCNLYRIFSAAYYSIRCCTYDNRKIENIHCCTYDNRKIENIFPEYISFTPALLWIILYGCFSRLYMHICIT